MTLDSESNRGEMPANAGDFRDRTIVGLTWSVALQIVSQLLKFVVTVVLARLLSPQEFGLMGMVVVLTGFAEVVNEMGLGYALVQRKQLEEAHLSTVFWVNLAAGAVWTAAFVALSRPIAAFYGEPALERLSIALSCMFLLGSLSIVQRNMLLRTMNIRAIFVAETTAVFVSGASAILAALAGAGVWSLVVQSLAITGTLCVMFWLQSPWRPRAIFEIRALRELFGYSTNLLGTNLLAYSSKNLDNLLIGKLVGAVAIGVYMRAYNLMLLPLRQVTKSLTRVMFPTLSAIQDDIEKVKRVYLQATRAIALVTFPMMVGLMVAAEPFVLAIYGEKWREVVPIIRVLCLTGMQQSVGITVAWIFNSQGRTDTRLRLGIYDFIVTTAAFVVGLRLGGVMGLAIAYVTVSYTLLLYPWWAIAGRLIHMRFFEMVLNLTPILFCAGAMGAAVWLAELHVPAGWPAAARLLVLVATGVAVYGAAVHFLQLRAYTEIRALVADRAARRSQAVPAGD